MTENASAKEIVDAAYRIHTTLGPGLLECVYDTVLAYELGRRGLRTVPPENRLQPVLAAPQLITHRHNRIRRY